MTILLTGDIHGEHDIRKLASGNFNYESLNLTKEDYLIICGDFGLIWDGVENSRERYWLDWLDAKPWTTLFVDGNHENHLRLNNHPVEEWSGGKIHRISNSVIHLMRGQVFNLLGKKFFTMGGAYSHDIEYRTPYKSWWPQEVPSFCQREEAITNLETHNWEVDCVITHDAPVSIAEILTRGVWGRSLDEYEEWLQTIADKLTFKQWFFGHHHQDREFSDGKFEAMYNDIVALDLESMNILFEV